MSLLIPAKHQYPAKDDVTLPKVQPLPMFEQDDAYLKRISIWLTKRRKYLVTEHYYTWIPIIKAWVWIPANFVFDFASVPKPLTSLFAPDGPFAYPSGPHDCNYRFGGLLLADRDGGPYVFRTFSRKEADGIFKDMANKDTKFKRLNSVATAMLRIFGWLNYKPRNIYKEDWSLPVRES